jgi:AcrR family transcriptional regulator
LVNDACEDPALSRPLWHNSGVVQTASRGPGRPPAAKAAETRERIVRAAREVFSELGYDAATFQAIAERSDLTRPAINHYFASKRVLYREVIEQTNTLIVQAGIEKAKGEASLLGQMEAFLAAATQADSADRSAAAFLVTSVFESQRHPELRETEHDGVRDTRAFLTSVISRAIQRGELPRTTTVGPVVDLMLAVLWGMGFYAGFVGNHEELEAVAMQLRRLMAGDLWQLGD